MGRGHMNGSGTTRMGRGRAIWEHLKNLVRRGEAAGDRTAATRGARATAPEHLQLLATEQSRGFAGRLKNLLHAIPRAFGMHRLFRDSTPLQLRAPHLTSIDGERTTAVPRPRLIHLYLDDTSTDPISLQAAPGVRWKIIHRATNTFIATLWAEQGNWHMATDAQENMTWNGLPITPGSTLLPLYGSDDAATSECVIARKLFSFRLHRVSDLQLSLVPNRAVAFAEYPALCRELRCAYPTTVAALPSLRPLLNRLTEDTETRLQHGDWIDSASTGQARWAWIEEGHRTLGISATSDEVDNAASWHTLFGYPKTAWTLTDLPTQWAALQAHAALHKITLDEGNAPIMRLAEDGLLWMQLGDLFNVFPRDALTSRFGPLTIHLRSDAAPFASASYAHGHVYIHPAIIQRPRHDALRLIVDALFDVMIERILFDAPPPSPLAHTDRYALPTPVRFQVAIAALALSTLAGRPDLPVHTEHARAASSPVLRQHLWMYLTDGESLFHQTFETQFPDPAAQALYALLRDHLFRGMAFNSAESASPVTDAETRFFAPTSHTGIRHMFATGSVISLDAHRMVQNVHRSPEIHADAQAAARAAQYAIDASNNWRVSRAWRSDFTRTTPEILWRFSRNHLRSIDQLRAVLASRFHNFQPIATSDQFPTRPFFFTNTDGNVFCVPDTTDAKTLYVMKVGERRSHTTTVTDHTPAKDTPRLRVVRRDES